MATSAATGPRVLLRSFATLLLVPSGREERDASASCRQTDVCSTTKRRQEEVSSNIDFPAELSHWGCLLVGAWGALGAQGARDVEPAWSPGVDSAGVTDMPTGTWNGESSSRPPAYGTDPSCPPAVDSRPCGSLPTGGGADMPTR